MKRGPEFYPAVKGVSGIYKLKISHIFAISGGSFVQILKFAASFTSAKAHRYSVSSQDPKVLKITGKM